VRGRIRGFIEELLDEELTRRASLRSRAVS
jgi:hypothetical protein